jgi:ABC-type Fe3+/spermidine/putrescine transport system ATPase subunit
LKPDDYAPQYSGVFPDILMKEPPFLEVSGVTKRFGGIVALDGLDLLLDRGDLRCILGPNGCGKTTTLRMIAGFDIPTSGKILLNGQDITNLP